MPNKISSNSTLQFDERYRLEYNIDILMINQSFYFFSFFLLSELEAIKLFFMAELYYLTLLIVKVSFSIVFLEVPSRNKRSLLR